MAARKSETEIRRWVVIAAAVAALITASSIPLGYAVFSHRHESRLLELHAENNAARLAKFIYANEKLWVYQPNRILDVVEIQGGRERGIRQRVFGPSGQLVFETEGSVGRFNLRRSEPIMVAGRFAGRIEIVKAMDGVVLVALLFALLGVALGALVYVAVSTLPIRALDRALGALKTRNEQLDETLRCMAQGLCRFDADRRIVVANDRYRQIFGLSHDLVRPGTKLEAVLGSRRQSGTFDGDPLNYSLEKTRKAEEIQTLVDGRSIRILRHPTPDGGWLATFEDVTERHAASARIEHLASTDPLTGLSNRAVFLQRIDAGLGAHAGLAVLLLDLDKFKFVNDTLGHPAGDALLTSAAQRLRGVASRGDVIARLGGDEFAILLLGRDDPRAAAEDIADAVQAALAEPFLIEGAPISVSASIGIAVAPDDGLESADLIKKADLALYRSKFSGRARATFFEAQMLADVEDRHRLEADLRAAIESSRLELHYQPLVDATTQRICGAEALLRWRHPELGQIAPDKFIPIAEESGLIVPLGEWVLQRACLDAVDWPSHVKVAVNLSVAQFRSDNLIDVVMCALVESGLPAHRLELEITESVFVGTDNDPWHVLRQLKGLGISIALDDFGTGYSSLSYLTRFPFDKLKVDKSFTQNMLRRARCAAIVTSALAIGRSLGMTTTAEGVETEEQFQFLRNAGVTSIQGYLFGKPGPATALDFDRATEARQTEAAA